MRESIIDHVGDNPYHGRVRHQALSIQEAIMTYRRTLELRIATLIAMNLWVFDLDSDDGSTCHHNSSPLNLPYLLFEQFTPHFADHRTCDAQSYLEDATERSSWDEYDRSYMTSWLECTRQDPQDSLTNHRCDHTYQDFANLIASGNAHACNAGPPPAIAAALNDASNEYARPRPIHQSTRPGMH